MKGNWMQRTKNKHNQDEDRLVHLRNEAERTLLQDATFTQELADKILRQVEGEPDSSPLRKGISRLRRRVLPVAAAVAAVVIVAILVPVGIRSHMGKGVGNGVPVGTTGSYHSPNPQLIQDEFGKVTRIQLGFSQAAILGRPNTFTITLSPAEQQELYHIMEGAKVAYGSNTPILVTTYRISFDSKNNGMEGSYRGDGAMVMPGDSKLGQNYVNTFAPNLQFAAFIDRVVMKKYAAQLVQDKTIFSTSPEAAAKAFVSHLNTPEKAYQYCIPGALFTNMTFNTLVSQNQSLHYGDMSVKSTSYFDGKTAALVHLASGSIMNHHTLDVRADEINGKWVVTNIGTKLRADYLMGNPSLSPMATHHVLIIGNTMPIPSTQDVHRPQEFVTRYRSGNPTAWDTADVIVYERQGITGPSHQQLPTKTSMGHPDPQAVQQLQSDPLFQQAVLTAKKNHAVLVVVGDSDHLLSQWLIQYALGIHPQGVAWSSQGSSFVTLTFDASGQPVFHAESAVPTNGASTGPPLVRWAVDSAELVLEQANRGMQ